jgi:flagellar FliL protein
MPADPTQRPAPSEPTDETPGDGADETTASAGKGRKLVALAAVLLAVALGAGVAYSQFGAIDRTVQDVFGPAGDAEGAPIEYGEFALIDGLVVNPAQSGGARYLMVSIGLESEDPAVLEEVTTKDVVVRDAINGLLSAKTAETLTDITQRDSVKQEIRQRINAILAEGEIERLYFTQFMLQ